jgi:hypothetical protein
MISPAESILTAQKTGRRNKENLRRTVDVLAVPNTLTT